MTISSRDRALLGVIAAVATVAAFYMLLLRPQHRTEHRLATEITAARATLAKTEQREAAAHAAEVLLRRTQGSWIASERAVPQVSDVPALLRLLQHTTAAAHVTMQSISLGAGGSSGSGSTASATSSQGVTEIPVSLTFTGGYQALNRLVHRLDTLVEVSHDQLKATGPLVGITQVSLSPGSGGSGAGPSLGISVTAAIYQYSAASTVLGSGAGS